MENKNKVEIEPAVVCDVLLSEVKKWFLVKSRNGKYAIRGHFGPDFYNQVLKTMAKLNNE